MQAVNIFWQFIGSFPTIENRHAMSGLQQFQSQQVAEASRAADDENLQRQSSASSTFLEVLTGLSPIRSSM